MKLFIVRHGESVGNVLRIIQGQKDYELTKKGFEQAEKIGLRLKDESFEAIYSSDLKRAADTAKAISKQQKTKLILTEKLRERNFGSFVDKQGSDLDWNNIPDDVETDESIKERILKVLNKVQKNHTGNVALITHGGVVRGLINHFTQIPLNDIGRIRNTSLSIFELEDNNIKPIILNCTKHLNDE